MRKRTVYKVIEVNTKGKNDIITRKFTCLDKQTANKVANSLQSEFKKNSVIMTELHREYQGEKEDMWDWRTDWKTFPDNAIEIIDFY